MPISLTVPLVLAGILLLAFGFRSTGRGRLRLLGFALLGIAVAGQVITAISGRRAAHSAPVVAVSFATSRPQLVTLDTAGTLVEWDLQSKRETRRKKIPELVGATELFIDPTNERAFAIANGKALSFQPFAGTPVETVPDARHIARGNAVVIARDQSLIFAPYADWKKTPERELGWEEPIQAIGANDTFLAVADRTTLSLLDGRTSSIALLASMPTPGRIARLHVTPDAIVIALDGEGTAWAIDVRRVVTGRWKKGATLVAGAKHVFLVSGREVKEYDPATGAATTTAAIPSGVRSIDTWDRHVAFGFEDGEVVLGTRTGDKLETERLTAQPEGEGRN